jgi:hypothetical protein
LANAPTLGRRITFCPRIKNATLSNSKNFIPQII